MPSEQKIGKKSLDIAFEANKLPDVNVTCNSSNLTMPKTDTTRKARFRAALALAGKTAESWAAEQGVTPGHLSQVLAGKRESRTLIEKVEAFTKKHVRGVAA